MWRCGMLEEEILEKLKECILQFDEEGASELSKKAVAAGIDPLKAVDDGLAERLNVI